MSAQLKKEMKFILNLQLANVSLSVCLDFLQIVKKFSASRHFLLEAHKL